MPGGRNCRVASHQKCQYNGRKRILSENRFGLLHLKTRNTLAFTHDKATITMILYYLPGACSLTIHIILEWIGEPYEAKALDFAGTKDAEYMKLNPMGVVPTLVDGDLVLTENPAIQLYLAEKFPESNLGPDDTIEGRYEMRRWHSFLGSDLHNSYRPLFGPGRLVADESKHDEIRGNSIERLKTLYTIADQHMEGRDHVVGNRRTVLDAYLFTFCTWTLRAMPSKLDDFANLKRFTQEMLEDSGVQAAVSQEGLEYSV